MGFLYAGVRMANKLIKKHDALAKKFLTDINSARTFLTLHLGAQIIAKCDMSTLTIESGSYIDDELRSRFSDILYRIELKNKSSCVYMYLLVEHQSSAEELMPVRILRYQLEIIQNHIDKYKTKDNLPLVVPLVLYNGKLSPYPYKIDILDLFADKQLIDGIGLGRFKLVDLTVMPENEILQHKKIALLEMCLKHIAVRDFSKVVKYILDAIIVAYNNNLNKSLFDSTLSYLIEAKEEHDLLPLFDKIIEHVSEYKEDIMTYAEQLRQEGRQQGRQEGLEKGLEKGRHDEKLAVVKELLKAGVKENIIATSVKLSIKEIEKIKKEISLKSMH